MFIDIHTHIDQYNPDELPGVLARASAAGVGTVFAAGTTVASSRRCVELAGQFPEVYAGVGVHPMDLAGELLSEDLDILSTLAEDVRVVVMSETGLDRAKGAPDAGIQERAFRAQIALAREHRLPVVFHDRGATEDVLRVLADERAGDAGGAAHYFQGDPDLAERYLDLGFYISFAKPLLRLPDLQDAARTVPIDRIVLETDSFPQPFKRRREKWTEPRDVPLVAAKLAELRDITVTEVEERTTENVLRMLGARASRVSAGGVAGSGSRDG